MEKFRVKVGDYDLIESGTIITMKDAEIHFFIMDLEYVFLFVQSEEQDAKIHIASNDGKKLVVELINFNSSFGTGNVNPIPMGRIGANDIFIFFRITQLDEGGKTMHYSWLSKPSNITSIESHE